MADLEEPHSDALIGSVKDALLAVDHEWFTDIHYHTGLAEELALAAIKAVRAYDEEHHG